MMGQKGLYALLQFSPIPERMEFLNVGVVLIIPERQYVGVRVAENLKRIEKLFGPQPKRYFRDVKEAFAKRISNEFSSFYSHEKFEHFVNTRANFMRVTNPLPIAVSDPDAELNLLFDELVGDDVKVVRLPRIATQLRDKFERAGVSAYVSHPEPIELPEGVVISTPYGYQKSSYNYIDPVRLSGDASAALGEAGKRAIEGEWLSNFSKKIGDPKKLIVVADFSNRNNEFYHAVSDVMKNHHVKLYRMDEIGPLVDDIKNHGKAQKLV